MLAIVASRLYSYQQERSISRNGYVKRVINEVIAGDKRATQNARCLEGSKKLNTQDREIERGNQAGQEN